jgi:hypothetical protein
LKWKDYRIEGPDRYKTMTLDTHEFIRRFLMHSGPVTLLAKGASMVTRCESRQLPRSKSASLRIAKTAMIATMHDEPKFSELRLEAQ